MRLPNGMINDDRKKGFRTSFLRDAHLSYFSVNNVKRIIKSAGLFFIEKKVGKELYFLLKKGDLSFEWKNEYKSNKAIFNRLIKDSFFLDYKNILKNEIKIPIRWLIRRKL